MPLSVCGVKPVNDTRISHWPVRKAGKKQASRRVSDPLNHQARGRVGRDNGRSR